MARTLDLYQLISQPESYRDEEWERSFLLAFSDAHVALVSDEPKTGPDGWPYLMVKVAPEGKEPVTRVISWLSEKGVGLAVNAYKMVPDYVFTYGMIWNFRQSGLFLANDAGRAEGEVVYDKDEKWIMGPPAESYLPIYVRKVLREFLAGQKLNKVLISAATTATYDKTDLIFSIESLGNPPPSEHQRLATALAWFLPSHYSIVLASEKQFSELYPL